MNRITENCFKKCTGKSGEHLEGREKQCLSNCMDRYMETMNVVSGAIRNRSGNQ